MPLQPGTTLGPYSVTAKIGEGGMGEVYRARDTKLDRDVALKVLPEAFTSDPDRLARFEREAKVLASLNHPNIGHIYGLEEAEGQKALVLELIEGPTLADRIKQGPIPIDEALPITKQIAEALEAAHEQGVIHRDLKPANVKVKDDGTVKVLDFGLAKAMQPDASDPHMSQSPTISLTAAATQMGMVIGTAAYMAPEQASGKVVDKRADVWAFGVVLYETLTGKRPFAGDDVSKTLARVIDRDPDWSALPKELPPVLTNFLRGYLEKEPRKRIRDIGDVRLAMEGAFETTVAAPVEAVTVSALRVWQRPLPSVLVGLALLVIGGLAVWSLTRPEAAPPAPTMRFDLTSSIESLAVTGTQSDVAISSDGLQIVYLSGAAVNESVLTVRSLGELTGRPLEATADPIILSPFLSPDNEWVGFYNFDERALERVSILGGPTIPIGDIPGGGGGILRGASWGADNAIIFGNDTPSGLWRIPVAGGEPEALTTTGGSENHIWPEILPGGQAVVFTIWATDLDDAQIAVLDLETGIVEVLVPGGHAPHYVSSGHLVYAAGNTVLAVGFDRERLVVTTNPVPVLDNVAAKASGAASLSVSETGTLVYTTATSIGSRPTLVSIDRDGRATPVTGAEADAYRQVRVSPDGRHLAFGLQRNTEGADIRTVDLERGNSNRVTTTPAAEDHSPEWTEDGTHLVFESNRNGVPELFRRRADGTGAAELLLNRGDDLTGLTPSWSNAGTTVLFSEVRGTDVDIGRLDLETGNADILIDDDFQTAQGTLSPDERWLAYRSNLSGQNEIYVVRYPTLDGRRPVSTGGGGNPVWSRDGAELFYMSLDGARVLSVPIETGPTLTPRQRESRG